MKNFKKNRIELLKAVQDFIKDNLDFSSVNADLESDAAEFITDLRDRKRIRQLKVLKHEVDEWMKELKTDNKSKHINERIQESDEVRTERSEWYQ
jgi:hypothetical protein